ncbi:hypothetical protein [Salmonella enterica]|uniref:hypothetical protein n=1 Tax=Salmonella enterica TaxID=28901 RepID=UPI000D582ECC|nr:hypothetical protein [Salmonella enterica]PVO50912.1 hypothetical protein C4743_06225 [Salmonella enterica subsp. enterica serovar Newport]
MKKIIIAGLIIAAFGLTGCKAEEKPPVDYLCTVSDAYNGDTGEYGRRWVMGDGYDGTRIQIKGDNSGFLYEDMGRGLPSPKLKKKGNEYVSSDESFVISYDDFGKLRSVKVTEPGLIQVFQQCHKN